MKNPCSQRARRKLFSSKTVLVEIMMRECDVNQKFYVINIQEQKKS